jgi:hypothetical protein
MPQLKSPHKKGEAEDNHRLDEAFSAQDISNFFPRLDHCPGTTAIDTTGISSTLAARSQCGGGGGGGAAAADIPKTPNNDVPLSSLRRQRRALAVGISLTSSVEECFNISSEANVTAVPANCS